MIRLFVIEDHLSLVISSLRYHFREKRDGIMIAGSARNIEEAVNTAVPDSFDLFLLDLYIPGYKPIENIRKLKARFPDKPVAIYTSETSTAWRNRMMKEGACTYIVKSSERDEIKTALTKAANGEVYFSGNNRPNANTIAEEGSMFESVTLSAAELEILTLLSEGLSHKKIAEKIGLTRDMIEKTLKKMRKYFNAENTAELIKKSTQAGII